MLVGMAMYGIVSHRKGGVLDKKKIKKNSHTFRQPGYLKEIVKLFLVAVLSIILLLVTTKNKFKCSNSAMNDPLYVPLLYIGL